MNKMISTLTTDTLLASLTLAATTSSLASAGEHPRLDDPPQRSARHHDERQAARASRASHSACRPGATCQRRVRSGCGIRMVARPSRLATPAMPSGEPFGLAG